MSGWVRRSGLPRGLGALLALVMAVGACGEETPAPDSDASEGMDPALALSREAQPGFEPVTGPRPLEFPADHGPHPETQTEWWYVTGNVETDAGRRFGFQFTIFRLGLVPPDRVPSTGSAWTTGELFMAHAAVTDADGSGFAGEQRLVRPVLGLAGAEAFPFRVWSENWSLHSIDSTTFFPLALQADVGAAEDTLRLALRLAAGKPVVLHGEDGYSRKGTGPGDASTYFSFTRMPVEGTVTTGGTRHEVTGLAWMDREWSTSVLSRNQRGWDWFGLHLADGRDLMFFELRSDVEEDRVREATLVDPDGGRLPLDPAQVTLEPVRWWTDAVGRRTPVEWTLRAPSADLDLRVEARVDDQQHDGPFRYWEGAVDVRDASGAPAGRGYAELTGYGPDRPAERE